MLLGNTLKTHIILKMYKLNFLKILDSLLWPVILKLLTTKPLVEPIDWVVWILKSKFTITTKANLRPDRWIIGLWNKRCTPFTTRTHTEITFFQRKIFEFLKLDLKIRLLLKTSTLSHLATEEDTGRMIKVKLYKKLPTNLNQR